MDYCDLDMSKKILIRNLIVKIVIFSIIFLFLYSNFVSPCIIVWQQGKEGEAELARAKFNRQIKVSEANAHRESAKAYADAEIIRAQGVAEANKIIGESLKENEKYLQYLWVTNLHDAQKQVIYIPTEANLPILESHRLKN